jgi:hypothetical protein
MSIEKRGFNREIPLHAKNCVNIFFYTGLECVGHSFAYVAHFGFLRDVWIQIQRAAVASRRATNLTTHLF